MHIQSSFRYQQWIGTWRSEFEQKTNGVLLACWSKRDTDHKDPEHIDFSVPRRARYVDSAWKRRQDAVFWVDIDLAIREGLTFYQTRSNAIILQGTLPAHCILKNWKIENWRECCMKDDICLLDHHQRSHWNTITIGLKRMINRVLQLNISQLDSSFNTLLEKHFVLNLSKPTQSKPNPICDRTGKLVETEHRFCGERKNVPFTRDCW